jgi:hypothetical protein
MGLMWKGYRKKKEKSRLYTKIFSLLLQRIVIITLDLFFVNYKHLKLIKEILLTPVKVFLIQDLSTEVDTIYCLSFSL